MAITVRESLARGHRGSALEALCERDAGASLPACARTLVLCPPHLLSTWTQELATVAPYLCVVAIDSLADVDRDADVSCTNAHAIISTVPL